MVVYMVFKLNQRSLLKKSISSSHHRRVDRNKFFDLASNETIVIRHSDDGSSTALRAET